MACTCCKDNVTVTIEANDGNWFLGDGTNNQEVNNAETVTFVGTNGATVTVSGPNTATINGHILRAAGPPAANPADTTQPWLHIDETNDNLYFWDVASGTWVEVGGGSFDITDGTTTETVNDGEQITFADGEGTTVEVSAPDTVTVTSHLLQNPGPFLFPPADPTKVWFGLDTANDVFYKWNPVTATWQNSNWGFGSVTETGTVVTPIDIDLDTVNINGDNGITTTLTVTGNIATLTLNGNFLTGTAAPTANPPNTQKCWIFQDETNDEIYWWDVADQVWHGIGGGGAAFTVTSTDTCVAGGIGNDYMVQSASYNAGTSELTVNGKPEHNTYGNVVNGGVIALPLTSVGGTLATPLTGTFTNPDTCRSVLLHTTLHGGSLNLENLGPNTFTTADHLLQYQIDGGGWIDMGRIRMDEMVLNDNFNSMSFMTTLAPGANTTFEMRIIVGPSSAGYSVNDWVNAQITFYASTTT